MSNKFKQSVRERMEKTGESYQAAHNALNAAGKRQTRPLDKSTANPSTEPAKAEDSEPVLETAGAAQHDIAAAGAGAPFQTATEMERNAKAPPGAAHVVPRTAPKSKSPWREVGPGQWAHDEHRATVETFEAIDRHGGRSKVYEVYADKPYGPYYDLADAKRAASQFARWIG